MKLTTKSFLRAGRRQMGQAVRRGRRPLHWEHRLWPQRRTRGGRASLEKASRQIGQSRAAGSLVDGLFRDSDGPGEAEDEGRLGGSDPGMVFRG